MKRIQLLSAAFVACLAWASSAFADVTFPITKVTDEATMANWSITNGDTFHRNTWSTENDESGMKTPFIEAWRGAGNNLNDGTISYATIKDLTPGSYTVKIFARAFNEGNTTDYPSGITFFANDTQVDMSRVGNTSLFNNASTVLYGTLEANCTVGEDGTLNIGFTLSNVIGDWLAFKNLEVIYNDPNIPEVVPVTGKMGTAADEAQSDAVEAYKANPTPDTYKAALAAIAAAQKSMDFYAPINNLDAAGLAAFPDAEAFTAGTLDETVDYTSAIVAAEKAQTTPGADLSLVVTSAEWTGATGSYGDAKERYSGSAYTAETGKVIYQHIEGLQPGEYKVKFDATANMAWIGAATGDGIAQVFVNDAAYDIPVIGQVSCTPSDYLHEYNVTVGDDGVLEYGLQNIAEGGNWYVAKALSLTLVKLPITTVGNEDNSSTWWTAFSDFYEINKGQIATISFDNYNAGNGKNWNNWLLVAQKENVKINGAGDDEYFCLRNDNYGWGTKYYNEASLSNNYNWDNFIADMNGSHVDMTLSMNDNGEIVMNSTITTAAGTVYNYSHTSKAVADVEGFEFFFTVELSHIKNLKVNIAENTPTAVNTVSAVKANAANGKFLKNGQVVIVKNGKQYNAAGALLK